MFEKILLATDASEASVAVVNCAKGLKELGAKECILAQCYSIREHVAFPDQIARFLKEELNTQKAILENSGIKTTVLIEPGLPGKTIPRLAKENDSSLIVIGSQGRNFASELFMGGTATEILHNMAKPVLVVPIKENEESGQLTCHIDQNRFLQHILFPTDFSNHARHAFEYVKKAVEEGVTKVTILHVQDKPKLDKEIEHRANDLNSIDEEFNRIDKERLEDLRDHLMDIGDCEVEVDIVYGKPANEILEKSKEDTSLIIMGSHGKGFVNELFAGSVSHNVARQSQTPVLLVPLL